MTSRMIGARMIASTKVGRTRKKSVIRIRTVSAQAAEEPGDDPDDGAEHDRDERRQKPDHHRDPRAVDGQVEQVAAELVGPEDVRGGRRLEAIVPVAVVDGLERADEQLRRDRERPRRPAG